MKRRLLFSCAILAGLGLIALGGAGFGAWLLAVLDGATVVAALLTAMAGFGFWSLVAAWFGLAVWRAWHQRS
ncbi:MAG: hypothetical protein OXD50_04125 [Chloroflexi bacterium]|nr:hypothetical protein [Chloroflexota bacterium]